jgi:predicted DNA-binding helix-hairpin-helix protein
VPGIGPTSAKRIIEARQEHSILSLQQLKKMKVVTSRALPFIWFKGEYISASKLIKYDKTTRRSIRV